MRLEAAADIRSMFNAPDRQAAEVFLQSAIQKYAVSAPRLSAWLEENLSEGFTVFNFPLEHPGVDLDLRYWLVGVEYYQGQPYVFAMKHFAWEP